jgi:hypothetical protein
MRETRQTASPAREETPVNRFQAEGVNRNEERPDPSDPRAVPGNPLYRILALYLPWSVLACFLPSVLAIVRRLLPGIPLSGAALALAVYVPALLTGLAVTLYLELLDPRTSHGGAHVRGAVLALVAVYLLSSLLSFQYPLSFSELARQFLPGLGNIGAALASLYIWIFVIRLRDLFRAREIFEYHLRRHQGEDLRRVMLEDVGVMVGVEERIRAMIRHYSLQLGIAFVLVLVCGFLRAPLSIFHHILTMLVIAAAAAVFSLLGLFRQEQYFAGEGIAVPVPERRKRLGAGLLFCAGAGLLAAFCALGSNILPVSLIGAFFAWLARILSRPGQPVEGSIELPQMNPAMGMDGQTMIQALGLEEKEPWPFWQYLPYIVLGLVIAAFLWFMIKPLFIVRAGSDKIPFGIRVLRLIHGGLADLKRALCNFFGSLGHSSAARIKISEGELRTMTEDLLSTWSGARKRELRQSLSLFARLILWGERSYQTSWKASMGPGEFCSLLAAAVLAAPVPEPPAEKSPGESPEKTAEQSAALPRSRRILRCGELFEEALYGPRLPDREAQREFRRLVEEITG